MGADSPHTTELTPEPHTKNNSSPDLKDSTLTKTFAFILVDDSNPERRKKNRSIAHSHVKRTNQRTKREQRDHTQEPLKKSVAVVVGDEDGLEELWSTHATSTQASSIDSLNSPRSSSFAKNLLAGLEDTSNSIISLRGLSPTIDLGFSTAFDRCLGTQDPRTFQMIDHCRTFIFSAGGVQKSSLTMDSYQGPVARVYARCRRRCLPSPLRSLVSSNVPKPGTFPYCGRAWSPALRLPSKINILFRFQTHPFPQS
jgi:hypothetical protein